MKKTCGNCRYCFSMEQTPIQKGNYRSKKKICVNKKNVDLTDNWLEFPTIPLIDIRKYCCPYWRRKEYLAVLTKYYYFFKKSK